MTQSPSAGKFNPLPTNKVVTGVITKEKMELSVAALKEAGFAETDIYVHHGEQGKEYLDVDGSGHGFVAKLTRSYQRLAGSEKYMLDDAETALASGHYLVGVQTSGAEEERVNARDALSELADYAIYFCGVFTITIMQFAPKAEDNA